MGLGYGRGFHGTLESGGGGGESLLSFCFGRRGVGVGYWIALIWEMRSGGDCVWFIMSIYYLIIVYIVLGLRLWNRRSL